MADKKEEPEKKGGIAEKVKDNKKLIIQAIVVLVCLGFMLESFAFGSRGNDTDDSGTTGTQDLVGVAVQNMTIMDYRPYLYTDERLDEGIRAEILALDGVEEIIDDATRNVVSLSDSENAPGVYSFMKRRNVTSYTLATLGMPAYFEMTLANGSAANVMGTRFEYMTEPVSKIGGKMLMRLVIQARGETPTGMSSIAPMLSQMEFESDAEISESTGRTFYYSIPWESRDLDLAQIEGQSGAGNVEYIRNENIILSSPLSTQEMLNKKYEYVETISEMAITTKGGFADRGRVIADFGEGITFMNSSLVIHSEEEPGLNFSYETKYIYTIEIPEKIGEYNFYEDSAEVVASGQRNGTIPITIKASVLGETALEIISVEEKEG